MANTLRKPGPGRPQKFDHYTKLAMARSWRDFNHKHGGRGSKRGFCRKYFPGELSPRTLDRMVAWADRVEAELLAKHDREKKTPKLEPAIGAAKTQESTINRSNEETFADDNKVITEPIWRFT